MMERNYPSPSFTETGSAAAQSAGWAYKPSSSYGSTQLDSELLQRQTFASSHQPTFTTTTHHPTGVFDSNQHSTASSNTTESSVMNFLSGIESRSLQAGPAGSTLLPSFRSPSWQTGANSSTELYLTGALHPSGTFPTPSALTSYQHPSAFPSRSFTTTSASAVQDSTFSSSNGLLSPNDPLLQLKSSQYTVPTALAFGGTSLGAGLPPQSSTYRSAQESAPHLLQPQFSLLSASLGSSQQAPQPYGGPIFSGSIERALQRECSVIKHHQRPSSTQPVQEQLASGAQHSLQGYLHDESDVSYQQDPSPHTPLPCSPVGDPSPLNSTTQQKTASQAALQQTQAYVSSAPSPGFCSSSGVKVKDGSSKIVQHPSENTDTQAQASSPGMQPQTYSSPAQKQSSVIASQSQPYTSTQLPGLVSVSASHSYITCQSLLSNLSQTRALSSSLPEKLPSIYKTFPSFASQSEAETSVSQSPIYSSSQPQDLPPAGNREGYETQVQTLCMGSPSQSYSTSHSQGLPTISFYTQGLVSASIPSQNYVSSQSLTPIPSFSPSRARSLSSTNPGQDYILMQSPPGFKTDSPLLQQKYLSSVQSSSSSPATHTQALPNSQPSVELKPHQQDERMFLSSKEGSGELPLEDVQALQKGSMLTSSQTLSANEVGAQNSTKNDVYVVSKMEDRHNTQSVIRSNSRTEEQILTHLETSKELTTSANTPSDAKSNPLLMHSTHAPLSADQLKQHTLLLKGSSSQQQNLQGQIIRVQPTDPRHLSEDQTQFIRVPSAQFLLDPAHMIVLQQPVLTSGQNQTKQTMYMQSVPVQYLQMNSDTVNLTVNGRQNQQVVSHQVPNSTESTKQDPTQKDNFNQLNPHDAKQNFTLNSVCFPDSMLLADERNILSNVDDILAATAAACGVTPQDFVKSTSSDANLSLVANPVVSKCNFQSAENRLDSFPSQHMIITNSQAMTIIGAQTTYSKDDTEGHQVFMLSNSNNQPEMRNNSAQEISDKVANINEKNNVSPKGHFVNSSHGSVLNANGLVISNTTSSDFQLSGQEQSQPGHQNTEKTSNDISQPKGLNSLKTDDCPSGHPTDGLPKKRPRSKGSSKQSVEDENGQPKSQKKSTQVKRQNSRASEASSTSTSEVSNESYQQQERMRQKLREVEEKQPEVKTGFLGSFLDFLKSGSRQNLSSPPIRSPNRTRKPSASKRPPNPLLIPFKPPPPSTPLISPDPQSVISTKRLDEELQRNLETLPSFSSDEDDSVGKNQDLQKSITSALSSLDEPSDKKQKLGDNTKQLQTSSTQPTDAKPQDQQTVVQKMSAEELLKDVPPDKLAVQLNSVAIEGLMDEELSDSGGEGMYRERDEFVVRNEDIERLEITLKAGVEPPAIWKVQKALLQKFVPELRDRKRVFFATNSYLGYFGDAKSMYRRVHVKFLDTVNKREYVRVCSRKPRCKPMHSVRGSQAKALLAQRFTAASVSDSPTQKTTQQRALSKPRHKQPKAKAEPPPKKRKKWKEEFTTSPSDSSPEAVSEDDEFTPPVPFASRFLNTRTMKETFKSFVELLISLALDTDVMNSLERENDELLLPHMKRVDGMITDNRRRLLPKLRMGQIFKNALDSFPELSVVTELKTDCETPVFKVRLSGRAYNRKTMKPSKSPCKLPLEYTVDQQKTKWFSLYHSLQHYKYHTYLMCMEEIRLLKSRGKDLGQEETVQTCMGNRTWVEGLFDRFGELLTQVQQACL
ncbi:glutamine and serine-rich protein 1 [Carassius carassius]|uniref:glutamine and serine-rich protein 1 n=1 Tax=Carassius carassius TaxID=217509 RepID=UPI0028688687|nr:glutamine and serine-rich protein 1 [Carassius carassius]